jgi:predicted  nucleic acid-binding Zn-ribbon protein
MEKLLLAITGLGAKFEELKTQLAAAKSAEPSAAAVTEISGLKTELATANATIVARDATITDLNAKLETAQGQVNAKGTEIQTLTAAVTAAEKKATDALAGMGVDPKTIPAAPAPAAAGGDTVASKVMKMVKAKAQNQKA